MNWNRYYETVIGKATTIDKQVFILFQEVLGCATCRNYGNELLTHPFTVGALETYFVPIAVYNNKGGADADTLRIFDEPSWNNPVSRIIDPNSEKDMTKKLNGKYDMAHLVSYISNGILGSGQLIPEYLDLLLLAVLRYETEGCGCNFTNQRSVTKDIILVNTTVKIEKEVIK